MSELLLLIFIAAIFGVLYPYITAVNRKHFAIFALIAFLGFHFVTQTSNPDGVSVEAVWTTPSCEFELRFPDKPKEVTREVVGFGNFQAAELTVEGAVFRADCMKLPPILESAVRDDPRGTLRAALVEQARRGGIEPIEIELSDDAGFVRGVSRGNKNVNGIPVTYQIGVALGRNSLMSAVIGGPSSSFPAPKQSQFLTSLQPKRRQEMLTRRNRLQ